MPVAVQHGHPPPPLPILARTMEAMGEMKAAAVQDLDGMHRANLVYAQKAVPNLSRTQELLREARQTVANSVMTQEAMLAAAQDTKRNVGAIGIAGIALGVVLAVLIARGIIRALKRVVVGLAGGAEQTTAAASQVSSSSQSLAQGLDRAGLLPGGNHQQHGGDGLSDQTERCQRQRSTFLGR